MERGCQEVRMTGKNQDEMYSLSIYSSYFYINTYYLPSKTPDIELFLHQKDKQQRHS